MTEPGTGSDLQGIKTSAVDKGDHYLLNGSKTFITCGQQADIVLVVCRPIRIRQQALRRLVFSLLKTACRV